MKWKTILNACLTLFPQKQINTELTLEIQRLTLTRQTSYKKLWLFSAYQYLRFVKKLPFLSYFVKHRIDSRDDLIKVWSSQKERPAVMFPIVRHNSYVLIKMYKRWLLKIRISWTECRILAKSWLLTEQTISIGPIRGRRVADLCGRASSWRNQ